MMSELDTPSTLPTHVDQSIPFEWASYRHDGDLLVVRNPPEASTPDCYAVEKTTLNPRVTTQYEAVLYDGHCLRPRYDQVSRTVEFVHDYAGTIDRVPVTDWFEDPVVCCQPVGFVEPDELATL